MRRLSRPTTFTPPAPELVHSVLSLSSAKLRWWVGKQVRTSFHSPFFGSYIERCRFASPSSGKALAEGWLEPLLQKSGLALGVMREVNHTRPFSSSIGLWLSVWLSQIGSGPQYGDGPNGSPFDDGVFASRTGCTMVLELFVFGSRIGTRSE